MTRPRVIAAFCYRYEPDEMVADACESLSWCDDVVTLCDRGHPAVWSPRADRQGRLEALVAAAEPDWVFWTAPDERLERGAEAIIREAVASGRAKRYGFHLREMWTPTAYRADGIWGKKTRSRLYPYPKPKGRSETLPLNLYHLKMIDPANRAERARVHTEYNTWDNKTRGFDYMTDERGLRLVDIPPERMYDPPYRPYVFSVESEPE